MTWDAANAWASGLVYGGYDNWRLPIARNQNGTGPCSGYCTGSEMGHLFYSELGGTAGQSILTSHDPDLAKFTNLQAAAYWSSAEYAPHPYHAWHFGMDSGDQLDVHRSNTLYAWAVRTGDVAARCLRRRGCWVLACWA